MDMSVRLKYSPEPITSITVYSLSLADERTAYFGNMPCWNEKQSVWLSAGFDPELNHPPGTMTEEEALTQGERLLISWREFYRGVYTNKVLFKIILVPSQTPEGLEIQPMRYFDPLSVVQAIENIPGNLKRHVEEAHCNDYFNSAGAMARRKQANS